MWSWISEPLPSFIRYSRKLCGPMGTHFNLTPKLQRNFIWRPWFLICIVSNITMVHLLSKKINSRWLRLFVLFLIIYKLVLFLDFFFLLFILELLFLGLLSENIGVSKPRFFLEFHGARIDAKSHESGCWTVHKYHTNKPRTLFTKITLAQVHFLPLKLCLYFNTSILLMSFNWCSSSLMFRFLGSCVQKLAIPEDVWYFISDLNNNCEQLMQW